MDNDIRLYLLVRSDLPSMNAGKAIAQGSHAANHALFNLKKSRNQQFKKWLKEWENQANIDGACQGFGTCISLMCNEEELNGVLDLNRANGMPAGFVIDTTYPYQFQNQRLFMPAKTAGWIFGPQRDLRTYGLRLYP